MPITSPRNQRGGESRSLELNLKMNERLMKSDVEGHVFENNPLSSHADAHYDFDKVSTNPNPLSLPSPVSPSRNPNAGENPINTNVSVKKTKQIFESAKKNENSPLIDTNLNQNQTKNNKSPESLISPRVLSPRIIYNDKENIAISPNSENKTKVGSPPLSPSSTSTSEVSGLVDKQIVDAKNRHDDLEMKKLRNENARLQAELEFHKNALEIQSNHSKNLNYWMCALVAICAFSIMTLITGDSIHFVLWPTSIVRTPKTIISEFTGSLPSQGFASLVVSGFVAIFLLSSTVAFFSTSDKLKNTVHTLTIVLALCFGGFLLWYEKAFYSACPCTLELPSMLYN